ncbi:drug/metabolite transporter (DMT)-like permease [Paucimonas lemoignei]|uniref:Drug/metabolite transporter (DMT)-like permease n=1 Tax=Paucimonas lemoignei TaxID=29443 RepID=A0A4R3HTG4_PAULE|nr:DMT family transporter [Paucimonas lemoignei]TCS36278.1 drug/metabolite transporter (DMT)-like permease [Paucimonas lemoignei]
MRDLALISRYTSRMRETVDKAGSEGVAPSPLINFAPAAFVGLWATGFIGGKLGLPYAGPLTFLLIRFIAVLLILAPLAFFMKATWPASKTDYAHTAVAGLMLHAGYLGGVFSAIHHGMSAGVVSLIVGLQPVLTAVLAAVWLKDKVTRTQWIGLTLGFIGVALVVSGKSNLTHADSMSYALALMALCSITLGTLYQKRYCPNLNLVSGAVIQYSACAVLYLLLAPLTENMQVRWTGQFIFALGWLVVVLSIASIMLLYVLIQRGAATRVTSLFYMVPPATAVMAWLIFNETMTGWALAGMALCGAGVLLVVRQPSQGDKAK